MMAKARKARWRWILPIAGLIIGAGIAGLVMAHECLDQGLSVHIVDRDNEENVGGLARWAFGGMALVGAELWFLVITISADNLAAGFTGTVFIAYLWGLTNVNYTATQYALLSSLASANGIRCPNVGSSAASVR